MLSIIVPVYNEEGSLRELHGEIASVCREHAIEVELIFVDDGSTDGSWAIVEDLSENDEWVSGIRFRRNFGKAAALTAGMRESRGERIMMMDADLQDDPAEIPAFLAKLDEGFDVVNGWKVKRLDPWHKTMPSKLFNGTVSRLTGLHLHDHNCGFKLFRREVAEEIRIYGELHRFIAVLAHARGFRVAELPVHHRSRQYGHSKYGMKRFTRGLLDLVTVKFLTGYGQRPQHLLGAIGLGFFLLGGLGLSVLGVMWLLTQTGVYDSGPIGSRPLLAYSVAFFLLGGQAMSFGLIAELVVSYTSRDHDTYSVRGRTGPRETSPSETVSHSE